MSGFWTALIEWLRSLFGLRPPPPTGLRTLRPRILMVVHNPVIEVEGAKKLTQVLDWNDPDRLAADYIADLKEASGGLLEPVIGERMEVAEWPVKVDGFRYDDTYVDLWRRFEQQPPAAAELVHQPDEADYVAFLRRFDILGRVARGEIDEVWWFAFPFAGLAESVMGGRGAFHCNSAPLPDTHSCPRRCIIMGFNYQRGVGEMLESFGHRCEDILRQVYQGTRTEQNLFERFCLYDQKAPGRAHCGTVHWAPNSERDYDWSNPRFVDSQCDAWLTYPQFPGVARQVNSAEWGSGDIRLHHRWWLQHFPRAAGATNDISNNWWNYVADPNVVP